MSKIATVLGICALILSIQYDSWTLTVVGIVLVLQGFLMESEKHP